MNRFERTLARHLPGPLRAEGIGTLQVNVGFECNQACTHCHLSASPPRGEESWDTMQQVVQAAGILRPRLVTSRAGPRRSTPISRASSVRSSGGGMPCRSGRT